MRRSISRSRAASSSYAARTAPARPISSRRCRCSRRGGACAGRSSPNAPDGGRRRLCALSRSRRERRAASARLGLVAGRRRGRRGAAKPHRSRARRVVARLLRPCASRLADAGDGFAAFPGRRASGAAFSTGSFSRSIPLTARGSASSSGRSAGATSSSRRIVATPAGSTRSSGRRPSSASPSPPRGSSA